MQQAPTVVVTRRYNANQKPGSAQEASEWGQPCTSICRWQTASVVPRLVLRRGVLRTPDSLHGADERLHGEVHPPDVVRAREDAQGDGLAGYCGEGVLLRQAFGKSGELPSCLAHNTTSVTQRQRSGSGSGSGSGSQHWPARPVPAWSCCPPTFIARSPATRANR